MEIEGEDGSKTLLKPDSTVDFGRGQGFKSDDRTVSRHHVAIELHSSDERDDAGIHFRVTGKNPVWVYVGRTGEVKTFRTSESGEMEIDDKFCVSASTPIWFSLKKVVKIEDEERETSFRERRLSSELAGSLQSSQGLSRTEEFDLDSIDVSSIDPVKEFGFLVIGHEFEHYPKQMKKNVKEWDWFIEELEEENLDNEVSEKKRKKGRRRKRKKGNEDDDEDEWTGESEDEKTMLSKSSKTQRPKYMTRSKDRAKPIKDKNAERKKVRRAEEESEDEDEEDNDETLGGFIVNEDDVEEGNEIDNEEEEEEEFVDEEDEDDEE